MSEQVIDSDVYVCVVPGGDLVEGEYVVLPHPVTDVRLSHANVLHIALGPNQDNRQGGGRLQVHGRAVVLQPISRT